MNDMKYITYDGPMYVELVIFDASFDHAVFADRLGIKKHEILTAGFVSIDHDGKPYCHGESVSLNLKSNSKSDTKILEQRMGKW